MPLAWTVPDSMEGDRRTPLRTADSLAAMQMYEGEQKAAEVAAQAVQEQQQLAPPGACCFWGLRVLCQEHRSILDEARALQQPATAQSPRSDGMGGDEERRFNSWGQLRGCGGCGGCCCCCCGEEGSAHAPGASALTSLGVLRRHLWRLCPKAPLACGMLASVLLSTASFCAPYVQGRVFDAAVDAYQRHDPADVAFETEIAPLLAVIGCIYLSVWALECAVGILFAVAAHTTLTRLRAAMFANLVEQDVAFHDAHVSGELSSRLINDSGQLQALVQFVSQDLLQASVRLVGALGAMYLTHPYMAALAMVVTPINWLIIRKAGEVQGMYGIVQNSKLAEANAAAVEALGAIRTVQSNTGETREAFRFASCIGQFLRVVLITVHGQTVVIFTQLLLSKMRDVVVLAVGMHQVLAGDLTIGSFTAFVSFVSLFEQGFSSLANIWLSVKSSLLSAGKFVQLLERSPQVLPSQGHTPQTCAGHLQMQGVSFSYPSSQGRVVLKNFDLEARPGSLVALVGASGAGKSTVARLIERFYDPTAGMMTLDGRDYRELHVRWLRRRIGFVEQEPTLFDISLADNIRYGCPEADDEQVERAAGLANAADFIAALPDGLRTRPGERGVRISGGQKQRLAIARAILKQPAILLLDEATSALDSANEAQVQQALDRLMAERTTVVIAHRLSTVVRASTIVVLSDGVVVERGTHAQLAADPSSHYAVFMRHQLVRAGTHAGDDLAG